MMEDDNTVSFVPYDKDNIDRAVGWDGFISPDGKFYKVSERTSYVSNHDHFAKEFSEQKLKKDMLVVYNEIIKNKPDLRAKNISYKDMLINIYGYVNYEATTGGNVEIGCPDPRYNGHSVTDKQVNMISELLTINNDNSHCIYQIFDDEYGNKGQIKERNGEEFYQALLEKYDLLEKDKGRSNR